MNRAQVSQMLDKFDESRSFGAAELNAKRSAAAWGAGRATTTLVKAARILDAALAARKAGGHSMTAALL